MKSNFLVPARSYRDYFYAWSWGFQGKGMIKRRLKHLVFWMYEMVRNGQDANDTKTV